MSEKEKKATGAEGTGNKSEKEPDSVIEVRHTYQTSAKEPTPKKEEKSAKEPTVKPETGKEGVKEPSVKTGEKPEKKDKVETPKPTVEELQAQLAAEKKRRETAELIVEAEATKQFETEKTEFLGLIPDEEKRTELAEKIGDDPEALNDYKRMSSFITGALERAGVKVTGKPETEKTGKEGEKKPEEGTGTGKGAGTGEGTGEGAGTGEGSTETSKEGSKEEGSDPAGKVGLPPASNAGVSADSYKEYVDTLYRILKDPTKSAEEKQIADKQVNTLFVEMFKGMKATGQYPHLPPTSACPNCGYILGDPANETCPRCGWKHMVQGIKTR